MSTNRTAARSDVDTLAGAGAVVVAAAAVDAAAVVAVAAVGASGFRASDAIAPASAAVAAAFAAVAAAVAAAAVAAAAVAACPPVRSPPPPSSPARPTTHPSPRPPPPSRRLLHGTGNPASLLPSGQQGSPRHRRRFALQTPRLLIRGGGAPTPGQADGDARTGEAAMVGPHRRGRRIGSGLDEPRLVHQLGRMFGEGVVGGRMLLGLCE